VIFIIPWRCRRSRHLLDPLHADPEWGVINSSYSDYGLDGPNGHRSALAMDGVLVHIWKALPFWTLI